MDVKLGLILDNACRLAGRDPALQGVPESWRVMAAFAVNAGLRRLYAEKLPMFQRIEYRRYRPAWAADAGFVEGQECWYMPKESYYRLESGPGSVEPESEGSGWRKLEMNEVAALVEFSQPWENTEIDPAGVDVKEFAYDSDPKYHPDATPIHGARMFGHGVALPSPAPKRVFCRFVPKAPRIAYDLWNESTAYARGSSCMSEGDVYRAMEDVAAGGAVPSAGGSWRRIRVDECFEEYLTRLAAAALLTEDQGKYQTQAAADSILAELVDRLSQNVGYTNVRAGRFRR